MTRFKRLMLIAIVLTGLAALPHYWASMSSAQQGVPTPGGKAGTAAYPQPNAPAGAVVRSYQYVPVHSEQDAKTRELIRG
jgi:hypothetical protein